MKDRLFERIAADSAPTVKATVPASIAALLEQATQAQWQLYPLTSGIEVATVRIDEASRRVDYFVRSLGPVAFPQHRHAGDEEILEHEGRSRKAAGRIENPN